VDQNTPSEVRRVDSRAKPMRERNSDLSSNYSFSSARVDRGSDRCVSKKSINTNTSFFSDDQSGVHNIITPKSRLATWSRTEMEVDLHLEEAWIDTEIQQARHRRQKEKHSSKGPMRSSKKAPPPSRPSSRNSMHSSSRPSSRGAEPTQQRMEV
jgi:hypothetical protein